MTSIGLVRHGRWGIQQKMTNGQWEATTINCGYDLLAEAEADVARRDACSPSHEFRVYDRWA